MKKSFVLALLLALPLTLGACGDDDDPSGPETPAEGSFSASISGDLDDSLDGLAYFGESTDPSTGETAWVLWLSTSESETSGKTLYFARYDDRPGTGTYALTNVENDDLDTGELGSFYLDSSGQGAAIFGSTGGSLVITDSDDDRMEGTFTVQATGTVFDGSTSSDGDVTITGEFTAVGGTTYFPSF